MATVRAFAPPPQTRRIEICRTAAQIFRDRGYDATSVSDIARALGITKAGLYHYFESKEALLFEITSYGLDRVRDEVILPARAVRDPEARLRQMVTRHALIATQGRGAIAQIVDEVRALPPPARKRVEERMRAYVDLVRETLVELRSAGRLRDVGLDRLASGRRPRRRGRLHVVVLPAAQQRGDRGDEAGDDREDEGVDERTGLAVWTIASLVTRQGRRTARRITGL